MTTKLETMLAAMTPAQRKAATALVAAMQAPAVKAAKRTKRLGKDHIVVKIAKAKVKHPRVYPYAAANGSAYRSETLAEVEGAVKVVLTSMGTLYWYDAKGVELANQVLPPNEAASLRTRYAHATAIPVWAK